MSGGRFDYEDLRLKYEIFGSATTPINVLEDVELSELVWDVFDLLHAFDWYASGDTREETYLDAKRAFKEKWFTTVRRDRIKSMVDNALEKTKQEIYKTFDIPGGDTDVRP